MLQHTNTCYFQMTHTPRILIAFIILYKQCNYSFQFYRLEKRFCKQCRFRWVGSQEPPYQSGFMLFAFFFYFVTTLFVILFSILSTCRIPYWVNGHTRFHRRKCPPQKFRDERVKITSLHPYSPVMSSPKMQSYNHAKKKKIVTFALTRWVTCNERC